MISNNYNRSWRGGRPTGVVLFPRKSYVSAGKKKGETGCSGRFGREGGKKKKHPMTDS